MGDAQLASRCSTAKLRRTVSTWLRTRFVLGSKSNDDAQYTSELVARGSFTVRKDTEMVYETAKRGKNINCSWRKYLPESVEERRMKDRGKKHSDFIGFIELYVEKLKEILQQNKTLRVIRRDTSQWHKITQYYVVAIRKLVRSGQEREKKYDQSILRVVGTVFNLEAWLWYYGVVREKRCFIVGGLVVAVVKYFSEENQLESPDWMLIPSRAPFLRWWIPW